MDLKDFIQTTVTQIVEGVVAAQAAVANRGAAVNPAFEPSGKGSPAPIGRTASGARVVDIAFDIAVAAMGSSAGPDGAKLQVAGMVSTGSGGDANARGEQLTRVQFALPISLPEARARRSAANALDSEYLQTVDNGDSTWLPR